MNQLLLQIAMLQMQLKVLELELQLQQQASFAPVVQIVHPPQSVHIAPRGPKVWDMRITEIRYRYANIAWSSDQYGGFNIVANGDNTLGNITDISTPQTGENDYKAVIGPLGLPGSQNTFYVTYNGEPVMPSCSFGTSFDVSVVTKVVTPCPTN